MSKDGDSNPKTTEEEIPKPNESAKENKNQTFSSMNEQFKASFDDRLKQFHSNRTTGGQTNPYLFDMSYSDDPKMQEMMRSASAGNFNFMSNFKDKVEEDDDDDDDDVYSPSYKPEHRLHRDIYEGKTPGATEDQEYFSDFDSGFTKFKLMTAHDIIRDKPLEVVSRKEWGALPPSKIMRPIKYPIKYIIISMKSESSLCFSKEECMRRMREMQKHHMEVNGLSDHPYNFMVGFHGTIYEGRGWNARPSNYIKGYPDIVEGRLDIAFFGDCQRLIDPLVQSTTIVDLAGYGVKNGMVDRFYDTFQYYEDEPPL